MTFRAVAALALLTLLGLAPLQLDSQAVLARYDLEMGDLRVPKAMIFSYSISQGGASDIEQRHRLYRSGDQVRDETLWADGAPLKPKIVRIGKREDRYAIARLAPRSSTYTMLFLRTLRDGGHMDYEYETTPLAASISGYVVERMIVDGQTFLPRVLTFRTAGALARGNGQIQYGKQDAYWVPLAITVDAQVNGKPARERITWSDYRFPESLPPSTFVAPKPLPRATLPPI